MNLNQEPFHCLDYGFGKSFAEILCFDISEKQWLAEKLTTFLLKKVFRIFKK